MSSGTLIEIDGSVFYLTAGHVVTQMNELLQQHSVRGLSANLVDKFGTQIESHPPIPFAIKDAPRFSIDIDGLDFGVIYLRPYYTSLLSKSGVIALSEEQWSKQGTEKFDFCCLLGVPAELSTSNLLADGSASFSPTMVPVEQLSEAPEGVTLTEIDRFIGRIPENLGFESIEGMSGGPIFGFRMRDGELRYWIVALQSRWLASRRIIFGCRLPPIGRILTTAWRGQRVPLDSIAGP